MLRCILSEFNIAELVNFTKTISLVLSTNAFVYHCDYSIIELDILYRLASVSIVWFDLVKGYDHVYSIIAQNHQIGISHTP